MRAGGETRGGARGPAVYIFCGVAVCVAFELVVFALLSILVSSALLPEGMIRPLAVLTAGVGALIGAAVSTRKKKSMFMTIGLSVGAAMCAFVLIFSAFAKEGGLLSGNTPVLMAVLLAGSALGALYGARRKKRKR